MGFSETVKKQILTISGSKCAFKDCPEILLEKNSNIIIGEVAHISGYKGPRYNPDMTDEQRNHFDNGIAVCLKHHKLMDNEKNEKNELKYTVSFLKELKKNHEEQVRKNWKPKDPEYLEKLLRKIITNNQKNYNEPKIISSFNIEDKIEYNDLKKYKYIFNENKIYHVKLETIYNEMEKENPHSKSIFLENIKNHYLRAKGELLPQNATHQDIRKNADKLIDRVSELLKEMIKDEKNFDSLEVLYGLKIILVDAFMRCKILEEPK